MEQADKSSVVAEQSSTAGLDAATKIITAEEAPRAEVSAATVGRMLGLATATEVRLLEGKLDLILTKVSNLTVRFEKTQATLSSMPNGSDLERIDVQIGMIRNILRDLANSIGGGAPASVEKGEKAAAGTAPVSGAEKRPAPKHKIFNTGPKEEPPAEPSSEK